MAENWVEIFATAYLIGEAHEKKQNRLLLPSNSVNWNQCMLWGVSETKVYMVRPQENTMECHCSLIKSMISNKQTQNVFSPKFIDACVFSSFQLCSKLARSIAWICLCATHLHDTTPHHEKYRPEKWNFTKCHILCDILLIFSFSTQKCAQ